MKKLFFLMPFLLLLASCQKYGDKITQRYVSQQGYWYWDTVTDGTGKITSNVEVFDSLYKVVPSKVQKYALAKKNGALAVCYIFLGLAIVLILFGIIYLSGGGKSIGLAAFPVAIILLICAVASIDWAISKEVEIPKVTYDSLIKADGNLKVFWDQNLYK